MKEPHVKDLANHHGREPCADWCKSVGEALSRGKHRPEHRTPKTSDQDADPVARRRRQHWGSVKVSEPESCGVEDRRHVWTLHAREPGDPASTQTREGTGSAGKGEYPNDQYERTQEVRHRHSTDEVGELTHPEWERSRRREGR